MEWDFYIRSPYTATRRPLRPVVIQQLPLLRALEYMGDKTSVALRYLKFIKFSNTKSNNKPMSD